ncbi:unnamed protein product [Spirodela intermedia]|uniref:Uncharacterized protein n=1 Tax=Spirodela intermedia TaxID=51605 RepID=A0A7I8LDI2_SPIIN|nr:unnamed protein product [Spirodela intermedia]
MGEDRGAVVAVAAGSESRKRGRADGESGDLERVAEIVMVLSAMGQIRGGRDPTAAEKALMWEAREKLAKFCESVELPRRKDLFTKEMAMAVVVDHGLNPPKENVPRPPKLSIAEKVANTKKKMEEAKEIAVQSSGQPSQLLSVSFGVKPESRGSLFPGAQRVFPDKPSPMPHGGLQNASPGAPVAGLASVPSSLKQSQQNEIRRGLSPMKPSSTPAGNDLSYFTLTLTSSAQGTPASAAFSVQTNKSLNTVAKVEGAYGSNGFQTTAHITKEQDSKILIAHAPGNQLVGHQFSQGANLHDPSLFNSHSDISKMVSRILPPRAFDQPQWTPPSTDYVNRPLNCQICKVIISDVESLLVCDACEKGVHMRCLLSFNQRIIPKAEWHCPQCLISSNGKPLPPKYGRVTRSVTTSRSSSSAGGVQASEKKGNVDSKVNSQQNSNGNPMMPNPSQASTVGNSHIELVTEKKVTNPSDTHELEFPITDRRADEETQETSTAGDSDMRADPSSISPEVPDSKQQHLSTGLLPCQMQQPTSEHNLPTKVDSNHDDLLQDLEANMDIDPSSQASNNPHIVNIIEVPVNCDRSIKHTGDELKDSSEPVEIPVHGEHSDARNENVAISEDTTGESMGKNPSSHVSNVLQTTNCIDAPVNSDISRKHTDDGLKGSSELLKLSVLEGHYVKGEKMVISEENTGENFERDFSEPSSNGTQIAEWVGDSVQAIEERSYYHSCSVNGVIYKLQDHVLVSSNDGKLLPSKLQALWEDTRSGAKWATVHCCYYPNNLPENVQKPAIPENDEVYDTNVAKAILVESISGPCHVRPLGKTRTESDPSVGSDPVFLCRWFYDASEGLFRSLLQ